MAEADNERVYEVLNSIQERMIRTDSRLDEVKGELTAIRGDIDAATAQT